jgi:hypothetical protein
MNGFATVGPYSLVGGHIIFIRLDRDGGLFPVQAQNWPPPTWIFVSGGGFGQGTGTVPSTGSYSFAIQLNGVGGYKIIDQSCDDGGASVNPNTGGYFGPLFYDGRLNDKDGQETSAVYCMGDGSVRVYVPGTPKWTIDFDASPAEIAKVPKNPTHNTLIKRGHFSSLSRQTNGLLLISSPGLNPIDGDYTFTFKDCALPAVQ